MTEFRPSRFEILPIVIKNILIINTLVFLAQITFNKNIELYDQSYIEATFGLHHVKSPLFQPWQLVTHLFMHGDFAHILYNMFALWMFGSILENIWGPKRFLTFYFLCGIGAGVIQLISLWFQYDDLINQFMFFKSQVNSENIDQFYQSYGLTARTGASFMDKVQYVSDLTNKRISSTTIGASGAVFGILAAFVYLFPNNLIYIYFMFPVKAKWIGAAYFAYEMYSAYLNKPGDNVAHWAHLGGGLVGFLLVLTWNKKNRRNFY